MLWEEITDIFIIAKEAACRKSLTPLYLALNSPKHDWDECEERFLA